jgi:error-prone DNA polymerase
VRQAGFSSIRDLWLRAGIAPAALRCLAEADAFASLGLSRRESLWAVRALRRIADKDDLPLFARVIMPASEPQIALPAMTRGQEVTEDYRAIYLSLKAHPVSFLRRALDGRGMVSAMAMAQGPNDARVTVGGLVLVRQRPGSGQTVFMTLEDETGIANVIVWARVFEAFRPIVMGARLVAVTGKVQKESNVVHLIADHLADMTPLLRTLDDAQHNASSVAALMPKGRNFH